MNRTAYFLVIVGLIFCLSISELPAQRGGPSGPGGLRSPGSRSWSPVREFEVNSFGAGDLQGQRPASGGGVLGSSIYSGGPPRGTPSSGGGSGDHRSPQNTAIPYTQRQIQVYDPMSPLAAASPASGGGFVPRPRSDPSLIATVLGEGADVPVGPTRPPLTSLAPPEEGVYRATMLKGEASLKSKDYASALSDFQKAMEVSIGAPEVHLSMAHTHLAMADGDYGDTATSLGRTLKGCPMLPMAKVHPKNFFAEGEYDRVLAALEQHVAKEDGDVEAMFVLGYLRWRDNQAADAIDILSAAAVKTDNPKLVSDIDLMLKGMGRLRTELAEDAPDMQPAEDYAQAGLRLSLPVGFRYTRMVQINRVLVARGGSADASQGISLAIFPLASDTDLATLMASATQLLNGQVGVSHVKVEDEAQVPFLSGQAHIRTFQCDYSGQDVVVARVCFIRESEPTDGGQTPRLGYVLGMGVGLEQADVLLPSLAAVSRSITMIDFVRPVDLAVSELGHDVTDTQWGFGIRQPLGWAGSFNDRGFSMGRFDNLLGGAVTPRVEVIASDVAADETPEHFGNNAITTRAAPGVDVTILSQGPAKLAGHDGYEFTIRKIPEKGPGSIEIGRLICVPTDGGSGKRLYALVVRCQDATIEQAQAIMTAIAPTVTVSP